MVKKLESTKVQDEIYSKGRVPTVKIALLFVVILLFTVLSNLSISTKLTSMIDSGINSMRSCPIAHDGIEISWPIPTIIIKSPEISPKCFGRRSGKALSLRDIPISLGIPSVYPFGLKLHTEIKKKGSKTKVNIYPTVAIGKNIIRITDTQLTGDFISEIAGGDFLKGLITVESLIELVNGTPTDGDLLLKSKNLVIPSQNLNGLSLPELKVNNFQVKGTLSKSKLTIVSFLVGDEKSPLIANFKGTIRLNKYNMMNSRINLSGEVKFSQELITAFPIINMLTSGKENQGGFYKVRLTGKLSSPNPEIL